MIAGASKPIGIEGTIFALTLAPPAFLAFMYIRFATDVPYADQWEFVPFLQKATSGSLSLADFWAQHNEHRIVFPRIIMLGLAWVTHWNIYAELTLNFLLGISVFLLMRLQIARAMRDSEIPLPKWSMPALSILAFSLIQWNNWFLGWQLQLWLSEFATLSALALLMGAARTARVGTAIALATIATFSFANGMLVWPLGCVALRMARPRARVALMVAWLFIGSAEIGAYFIGYHSPSYHPAPGAALREPGGMIKYICIYLGQPVIGLYNGQPNMRFALGGAGMSAILGMLVWLWAIMRWRDRMPRAAYSIVMLWPLYSLGSALLTAYARAPMGLEQALSSRYATLAIPFWAGVILLSVFAPNVTMRNSLLCICSAFALATSLHGAYRWTERYHVYTRARAALIAGGPATDLHWLYPDTKVLLERRAWLQREGWSVFHGAQPTARD